MLIASGIGRSDADAGTFDELSAINIILIFRCYVTSEVEWPSDN